MLRVIVHVQDGNAAAHVEDAKMVHSYRTFTVLAPELEALLTKPGTYAEAQVVGVEVVAE